MPREGKLIHLAVLLSMLLGAFWAHVTSLPMLVHLGVIIVGQGIAYLIGLKIAARKNKGVA